MLQGVTERFADKQFRRDSAYRRRPEPGTARMFDGRVPQRLGFLLSGGDGLNRAVQ